MIGFAQHEPFVVDLNVIVSSAKNERTLKNVMVIIGGDTLHGVKANSRNEFDVSVRKNTETEITFIAKGYVPKTIIINTFTKNNIKRSKRFELELLLSVKEENFKYHLLDFPIVKIYYDCESNKIKYNKSYNSKMKIKYRKVLKKIKNDQLAASD